MPNLSNADAQLVLKHIQTNPKIFLEVLNNSPVEQQRAIVAHLRTLPDK